MNMTGLSQKLIGAILLGLSIGLLFILIVVKINQDREGAFLCKVVDENPDLSMDDCPAHESSSSWLLVLAFVIVIIMLMTGVMLIFGNAVHYERKQEQKEERKIIPVDVSKLDDEEKKIVLLLQEQNGSVYQSDIVKNTGFSKVHTTRVLDKLEMKEIIERKRRGMTNIVVLR